MSTRMSVALVAALSLSAVTVASAAGMSHSPSSSMMSTSTSDTLTLSSAQRKTAWNDLSKEASKQTLPTGYSATAGSVVPNTLKIQPIPEKTAKDVPSLKSYDFAVLQGKVLIVNPSDKKIVDVITG